VYFYEKLNESALLQGEVIKPELLGEGQSYTTKTAFRLSVPEERCVYFILNNEIVPAVNQVETHPFNQQVKANEIMKEYGVQIESWGPFAEGKNGIFTNEILSEIGKKYNKSVAQVILRWLIQRDVVVIPNSVRKERIEENL